MCSNLQTALGHAESMNAKDANTLVSMRLRATLDELGMTIRDAARQAGMSTATLYPKLRGERNVTWTELVSLSIVIGRHPGWFLRDRDA
jgi:transcriptional regulator with XRE-family HTH domain